MTRAQAQTRVVLSHLAINIVHGRTHTGVDVPLSLAGTLFVFIVILAGPIVGLVLSCWRPRAGGWVVAACQAGALVFGLVNHFIIDGTDHVARAAAKWRPLFGVTAALLVIVEAVCVIVGIRSAAHTPGRPS